MLSAATLPRGHVLIKPYLFDVTVQGTYDSNGTRRRAPHSNDVGSLTYMNYALANRGACRFFLGSVDLRVHTSFHTETPPL